MYKRIFAAIDGGGRGAMGSRSKSGTSPCRSRARHDIERARIGREDREHPCEMRIKTLCDLQGKFESRMGTLTCVEMNSDAFVAHCRNSGNEWDDVYRRHLESMRAAVKGLDAGQPGGGTFAYIGSIPAMRALRILLPA